MHADGYWHQSSDDDAEEEDAPRRGVVHKRARAASPVAPAALPASGDAAAQKRARAGALSALAAAATGSAAGLSHHAATAAPPQHDAAGDAAPSLVAFLRAIRPPLSQLAAALAALPESGLSVAHLACIASSLHASPADRKLLFDELSAVLHITRAADRIGFMNAVLALAARGGA